MTDTLLSILNFILLLKPVIAMVLLLNLASFVIWVERKGSALMQDRIGANRAAFPLHIPFTPRSWTKWFDFAGMINTLVADPAKAVFKEDWVPKGTGQLMHSLAPFLALFPVIVSFAVIPFGPPVTIGGVQVPLQVAKLDVGVLFVFAFGSLAVYGVVLAGWVSNNKFSMLGGLRASAQMISYEVTMGISLLGILMFYGTLEPSGIIESQSGTIFHFLPRWGVFLNPLGLVLFFVSMMAETKRAPFDLPESESEIVAGYLTEYSGMKFLLFWFGEFAEIVVASALITVVFFGGWQLPYCDIRMIPSGLWGLLPAWFDQVQFQWAPIVGLIVFGAKVAFFCVFQVAVRWTLPRFRYDQLMTLCWKRMLPLAMLNVIGTAGYLLWRAG